MWGKIALAAAVAAGTAAASAESKTASGLRLSGPVVEKTGGSTPLFPLIGIVADSQLQTREQNLDVPWYRSRGVDKAPQGDVAIRPPALDWSARFMLEAYLEQLKAGGAKAIFFLGDGANHGCHDEFLRGLDPTKVENPKPNDRGILRLLDDFRRPNRIPIYFVIGNHDFMGAGSTSQVRYRKRLCDDAPDSPNPNRVLSRFEVIEAIDAFNRGNAGIQSDFKADYISSVDSTLRGKCLLGAQPPTKNELRRQGCYYAAVLNYPGGAGRPGAQFMLLDTTDNADVSLSRVGRLQVESLRGAMSFSDRENSQTAFLRKQAEAIGHVPLRVALTHYPVKSLTKWNMFNFGGYSQRFLDLFVATDDARPLQDDAFVLSGHTHGTTGPRQSKFKSHGGTWIGELNVGSTTDSSKGPGKVPNPPHAALVGFAPTARTEDRGRTELQYRIVKLPAEDCEPVYASIGAPPWAEFGLDPLHPKNYRRFSPDRKRAIFAALERFAGDSPAPEGALKARCIGLRASELEGPAYERPPR